VISLLSCASAEIYVTAFLEPPSWISDSSGMSVPDNVGVAFVILFLASVELKIYCMLYAVHNLYLLLPVLSRHIGYLVGARLVLMSPSCSSAIFK